MVKYKPIGGKQKGRIFKGDIITVKGIAERDRLCGENKWNKHWCKEVE